MPVGQAKIAQLELALAEAKAEFEQENGRRYEVIVRDIDPKEMQRIMDGLTDRREKMLFGLEAPEQRGGRAKSGGNLECPICQKTGLTEKGLKLHTTRKHGKPVATTVR